MKIQVRVSEEQYKAIEAAQKQNGFESISSYMRYVAINATVKVTVKAKPTATELVINEMPSGSIQISINKVRLPRGNARAALLKIAGEFNIHTGAENRSTQLNTRELGRKLLRELPADDERIVFSTPSTIVIRYAQ